MKTTGEVAMIDAIVLALAIEVSTTQAGERALRGDGSLADKLRGALAPYMTPEEIRHRCWRLEQDCLDAARSARG